jgi:hypothetical protein
VTGPFSTRAIRHFCVHSDRMAAQTAIFADPHKSLGSGVFFVHLSVGKTTIYEGLSKLFVKLNHWYKQFSNLDVNLLSQCVI